MIGCRKLIKQPQGGDLLLAATTTSFVTEIPLIATSRDLSVLAARCEAGRQLYNAVLSEGKTRLELFRNSKLYRQAKAINKANKKERSRGLPRKENEPALLQRVPDYADRSTKQRLAHFLGDNASTVFQKPRESYRFSDYDLQAFANKTAIASVWIKTHLDANTIQKIATRAFKALEKMAFGKARKVRFKQKGQFASLEGKTNKQGIRAYW